MNDANQTVTIKNERKATTQFSVTKKLTGREATANDTFTFELVDSPDAADVLDNATVTGNGTAEFKEITLTTLEITFTISVRIEPIRSAALPMTRRFIR